MDSRAGVVPDAAEVGMLGMYDLVPPPDHTRAHMCIVHGCGKRFANLYNLEKHMSSHSDERPFKCPVEGVCVLACSHLKCCADICYDLHQSIRRDKLFSQ